jgi:hypothetical protein
MSVRFCPTCSSDVEVADGFCLLGHSVRLEAQMDQSLSELRAEVDKAFAEARVVVTTAMGPPPPPPPPADAASQASAPSHLRPAGVPVSPSVLMSRQPAEPDTIAVGPTEHSPARATAVAVAPAAWAPLATEPSLAGTDPIEAFAPPPRIDWGPDRIKGFKRRATR